MARRKFPPRKQCAKCPWKKSTNPHEIPDGYSPCQHRALRRTIAEPGAFHGLRGQMRMMACHEYPAGAEMVCVGWMGNQLGPGNNLGLRMAARSNLVEWNVETVGEQHEHFEDTLPEEEHEDDQCEY